MITRTIPGLFSGIACVVAIVGAGPLLQAPGSVVVYAAAAVLVFAAALWMAVRASDAWFAWATSLFMLGAISAVLLIGTAAWWLWIEGSAAAARLRVFSTVLGVLGYIAVAAIAFQLSGMFELAANVLLLRQGQVSLELLPLRHRVILWAVRRWWPFGNWPIDFAALDRRLGGNRPS